MDNRFIGTKIIIAEAMTRAAYVAFRGWQLPADENGADEGYLVEYEPDGKPNVEGRAGYVSWTPKAAFDAAYKSRPLVPGLLPHQQRVVDECAEMNERTGKLGAFIATDIFATLDQAEKDRLVKQAGLMNQLVNVLSERIQAFPKGGA